MNDRVGPVVLNHLALRSYAGVAESRPLLNITLNWGCHSQSAMGKLCSESADHISLLIGVLAWLLKLSTVAIPGGVKDLDTPLMDSYDLFSRSRWIERAANFAIIYVDECDYLRIDHCGWPPHPRLRLLDNCDGEGKIDDFPARGVCSYDLWQHFATNGSDDINYPVGEWNASRHHERLVAVPIPRPLRKIDPTPHVESGDPSKGWSPLSLDECSEVLPPVQRVEGLNWRTAFSLTVLFSVLFLLTMVLPVLRS